MEFHLYCKTGRIVKVPGCRECQGYGESLFDTNSPCFACRGEGYLEKNVIDLAIHSFSAKECAICTSPLNPVGPLDPESTGIFKHKNILYIYCKKCKKARNHPLYEARRAFWA